MDLGVPSVSPRSHLNQLYNVEYKETYKEIPIYVGEVFH